MRHFFVDIMDRLIPPNWPRNNAGWRTGNCVVCHLNGESRADTRKRGGMLIGPDFWVYNCFNCHMKIKWEPGSRISEKTKLLLRGLGCDEQTVQKINLGLLREENAMSFLDATLDQNAVFYKPDWPEVDLPEGSKPIFECEITKHVEKALLYLNERKLTHWTDWYISEQNYITRIILPCRYKEKIVGYTTRIIGDITNGIPKYIGKTPPNFVFNLDNQTRKRNHLVVTEGFTDAISLDGVSLCSNSVNANQAQVINRLGKRTILLPDGDKAGTKTIEDAIKHGWWVSFPPWLKTYKDANKAVTKLGRAFVLYSVLEYATDNSLKIRVQTKRMK